MSTGVCTWQDPGTRFGRARAAETWHLMGHSAEACWGEVEREGAGWIVASPGADPGGPQWERMSGGRVIEE